MYVCCHMTIRYKKNPHSGVYPANYVDDMEWSKEYLRQVTAGAPRPLISTISQQNLFSGQVSEVQTAPPLLEEPQLAVKIKQEKRKFAFLQSKKIAGLVIDLEDDSPRPKKSHSLSAASSDHHPAASSSHDTAPAEPVAKSSDHHPAAPSSRDPALADPVAKTSDSASAEPSEHNPTPPESAQEPALATTAPANVEDDDDPLQLGRDLDMP